MPKVVKIVGIKSSGISPKTQKPWAITQVQLDSGQVAETFDTVREGDTGEISFNAQYNSYGFKKDRAANNAAPSASAPQAAPSVAKYQPKDEQGIKAMWAIGQAVSIHNTLKVLGNDPDLDMIEGLAGDLFAMVDRIKEGGLKALDYEERPFSDDEAPAEDVVDDL